MQRKRLRIIVAAEEGRSTIAPPSIAPVWARRNGPHALGDGFVLRRNGLRGALLEHVVATRISECGVEGASEIEVRASERSEMTLTGFVATEEQRLLVGRIAEATGGVARVLNRLTVDPERTPPRARVDDEELAQRVVEHLAKHVFPTHESEEAWLSGWDVDSDGWNHDWEFDVEVEDGAVTLRGIIDDVDSIFRAVESIRGLRGVRSVRSLLIRGDEFNGFDPFGFGPRYGYAMFRKRRDWMRRGGS